MTNTIYSLNPRLLFANHIGAGNMPSNVKDYGTRVTQCHELEIIPWGDGIDYVNGEAFPVKTADIFYRTPRVTNLHVLPYHCYFFGFDPYYDVNEENAYQSYSWGKANNPDLNLTLAPITPFAFSKSPCLGKATDLSKLVTLSHQIFLEFNQKEYNEFKVKTLFLTLLYEVSKQLHQSKKKIMLHSQYYEGMTEICNYIKANPQEHFTVEDMSRKTKLSAGFFCKVFKEFTGETLVQFVNRTKIDYVKILLLDTNKTVDEIAYECNFCDATYLHTLFKKITGCTPAQYKKETGLSMMNG